MPLRSHSFDELRLILHIVPGNEECRRHFFLLQGIQNLGGIAFILIAIVKGEEDVLLGGVPCENGSILIDDILEPFLIDGRKTSINALLEPEMKRSICPGRIT
ncbi:hypothetical protein D3C80_1861790 [compost metagenome]